MSKTYKNRNESGFMSSNNYLRPHPKILVTGDSFCGIFKLFRVKDAKMDVNKIKGATLKGLTKADNANRIAFEQRFNVENVLQYALFSFGQVDLHFSFYYDLICKSERDKDLRQYYKKLADEYVHFISTLASTNGVRCFVLAIYPSPVEAFRIPSQLAMYGVLTVDQILQLDKDAWWEIANFKSRSQRLELFNNYLRDACALTDGKVTFLSINDKLLHPDGTVRKEFIDLSPYNVHLLWEPLISLWAIELAKWNIGLDPSLLTDTNSSGKLYEQTKSKAIQEKKYGNFDVGPRLKDLFFFLLDQCKRFENITEELNLPPEIEEKNEKDTETETERESNQGNQDSLGENNDNKSSLEVTAAHIGSSSASLPDTMKPVIPPSVEDFRSLRQPNPSTSAIPLDRLSIINENHDTSKGMKMPYHDSHDNRNSKFPSGDRRGDDYSQPRSNGYSDGRQRYYHPNSRSGGGSGGGRSSNSDRQHQYHDGGSGGDGSGRRQGGYVVYPPSVDVNSGGHAIDGRTPPYNIRQRTEMSDRTDLPPPPSRYSTGRGEGQQQGYNSNRGSNQYSDRHSRHSHNDRGEPAPRELSWRSRAKVKVVTKQPTTEN